MILLGCFCQVRLGLDGEGGNSSAQCVEVLLFVRQCRPFLFGESPWFGLKGGGDMYRLRLGSFLRGCGHADAFSEWDLSIDHQVTAVLDGFAFLSALGRTACANAALASAEGV